MKKVNLNAVVFSVLVFFLASVAQAAEIKDESASCEHWRVIVYDNASHQEVVEVQAILPRQAGEVYEFEGKTFEEGRARRVLLDTRKIPSSTDRSNDLFIFRDKRSSETFVLTTKKEAEAEKQKCQKIGI